MTLSPHDAELVDPQSSCTGFKETAEWRPMVERSISWLVADTPTGPIPRCRRNQLGLSLRIAAINLRRMVNLGLAHDGTGRCTT